MLPIMVNLRGQIPVMTWQARSTINEPLRLMVKLVYVFELRLKEEAQTTCVLSDSMFTF